MEIFLISRVFKSSSCLGFPYVWAGFVFHIILPSIGLHHVIENWNVYESVDDWGLVQVILNLRSVSSHEPNSSSSFIFEIVNLDLCHVWNDVRPRAWNNSHKLRVATLNSSIDICWLNLKASAFLQQLLLTEVLSILLIIVNSKEISLSHSLRGE